MGDHESAQENAAEINRLNKASREERAVHDEALKQQMQQVDTEKAAREKLQAEESQEKAKVAKQRAELDLSREQLEKEKSQLDMEKVRVAATSATNATPSKNKNITA